MKLPHTFPDMKFKLQTAFIKTAALEIAVSTKRFV
jgi:hypothetical protein